MGYRIWSLIQSIFGLILGWLLLDIAVDMLWINGFLDGIGNDFLSSAAVVAWLVIVIVILQLLKSMIVKIREE